MLKPLITLCLLANSYLFSQTYLFVDSLYEYKVQVPSWLQVNDDVDFNVFGGELSSTDNTINHIYVHGFEKSKFKSFSDFTFKYISGNVFGKESLFDPNLISEGKKQKEKVEHGIRCKTMFKENETSYHYEFYLLETPNNYLWIYFKATPETFEENLSKMETFIEGLELLQ